MLFSELLRSVCEVVWGFPLIILLMSLGIYFSWRLRFVQVRGLGAAFRCLGKACPEHDLVGDISHFAALCTALSATLGTGNIVGIAVALKVGGPGALFWMILSSFFSLPLKYAEGTLAVKYRVVREDGTLAGGPMYTLEKGLRRPFLAKLFALFGVAVALVGIGTMAQTHSIATAAQSLGVPLLASASVVTLVTALVIWGGLRRIAETAEKIVPFMVLLYLWAATVILFLKIDQWGQALHLIVTQAFSRSSLLGGGAGLGTLAIIRIGITRGLFCHESGLGSAAIAAAAAKTKWPAEQGLVSMMGAFLSVLICCVTSLVLMVTASETHLWSAPGTVDDAALTATAFGLGLGAPHWGAHLVHLSIIFFAFTSIIGWNYYGETCIHYLFKKQSIVIYRSLFLFFVALGPFLNIHHVFILADIVTGLMVIPNLVSLIGLRREVIEETEAFEMSTRRKTVEVKG